MPVIPAFGSQKFGKQNFKVNISDSKFGAILGYMTPCPPKRKKKQKPKKKRYTRQQKNVGNTGEMALEDNH